MFELELIKKSSNVFNKENLLELSIKRLPLKLKEKFTKILKEEYKRRFSSFAINKDWDSIARDNQRIPKGDWFVWLILAGRGFGKTRSGAEAIKKLVLSGKYKRIALVGETFDQIRTIMLEGESGLLNLDHGVNKPTYVKSQRQLFWPNGAVATFYSAENPEQLRGPQFDLAWIDELAKFEKDQAIWDQLMFCLRLGESPKVIVTTTPRSKDLIFDLANRTDVHLTKGSTFENSENLSPVFLKTMQKEYSNTKFGKQEIFGELVSRDDAQLWCYNSFTYSTEIDQKTIEKMDIIIAVDPAMTAKDTSDETGIIVAGRHADMFYILADESGKMDCVLWMKKLSDLYHKYKAKKIIIETNQGGDLLISMLQSFENLPWKGVRAKIDKYSRAIPIAALYDQKRVVHIGKFKTLETQLLKAHLTFSDDRLDALTWALFELNNRKDQADFFQCL